MDIKIEKRVEMEKSLHIVFQNVKKIISYLTSEETTVVSS